MAIATAVHPSVERARTLDAAARQSLRDEIGAAIEGELNFERAARLLYATDASIYQMEPAGVVFPRTTADIAAVVRICAARGVAVLPRGGGTSLAGQAVNHAVVIDCSRFMNRILEVNVEEQWARVQPGVVIASLNREAARHGLQYPVDPATSNRATIGGGIGNNSCGAHSVIYGKTVDQVLSLEVVLADGTVTTIEAVHGEQLQARLGLPGLEGDIYRETQRIALGHRDEVAARFPKILRRVSGYNLDAATRSEERLHLGEVVVGSEGTLAVVAEARVRLVPVPAYKGLAAVHFDTVIEAASASVTALEHGPSAVELIDHYIIAACRSNPGFRRFAEFIEGNPGGLLYIEFYGDSEAELEERLARLRADFESGHTGYYMATTTDPSQQRTWWRVRESGLGLMMSVRGDAKPIAFVEDTAVAPGKLPAYVERFNALVASYGKDAGYYGHASVGCLHIRTLIDLKDAADLETMKAIASDVADLVLEFGGSLSGEHGDGILRGVFTERMFGARLTQAFRDLKRAWDPHGILNPGKIVDTPSLDDYLRISPQTRNAEPQTFLDFTLEGGLAGAVEQCNGQGACRKFDGGMCPSYMATMDEEHSTRGRANLLRMALSGVIPPSEMTGDRIYQALDLCVECKACAAECPSGVDMAKIKYEVLAQRHEERGATMRDRLFAYIGIWSGLASRVAPLANAVTALAPVREAMHRFVGIHRERPLPRLASRPFARWWERHQALRSPFEAPRGEAVLFDDTFTRYYHPEVGIAATHVLETLGYRVVVIERRGCCGRPLISKGMLGTARRWAARNVDALLPYAARGVPIVGTEPSCLLSLRDEYPDLLRSDESRTVAGRAVLLDELVATLAASDDTVRELFDESSTQTLVHTHCHQKALAGSEPTLEALGLAGGASLIDSGCCGMAGAFGFEAEHYEVSRQMGALRLFPAIEASNGETTIAVTGVSCRQQIGQFTSRQPRHTAELLADALRDSRRRR